MAQKRKRNHWVPQSYLRGFAADTAKKKIWRCSKGIDEPPGLKPIEKVAVRFYLYAPMGPNGRDYRFEEKLSGVEQLFGLRMWAQIATDYVDLSDQPIRKGLALLAAVMALRNPRMLDHTRDQHRYIVKQFSQLSEPPEVVEINGRRVTVDRSSWPAFRDASDDDIKREWLREIGSATWLAELMMDMRWAVVTAEKPSFVTSDSPVMFLHPSLSFRGLRNPETLVAFPLSPTRMLVMDNRHTEPRDQYYPLCGETAADWNGMLWRDAIECVFSSRDPIEVFEEILATAA